MRKPAPPPPPEQPAPIVFRWDLDKTYLKTEFDTLRDLVRIPFERAEDKVNVPGVIPLMHGLKQAGREVGRDVQIHFISASPPQIGTAIREKLRLDGVEYDDIIFKNQLQNIVRGKFRNLREQIGYKLSELLASHQAMPANAREVLFGDDWESDPIIYSMYADVLSGQLKPDELGQILQAIRVDAELVKKAVSLCPADPAPVVLRIYINLERRTPLENFRIFGPRLVPAFNYLQTAACLFQDGHLQSEAVVMVAQSLVANSGYTPSRIANSLADIERRGHVSSMTAAAIRSTFATHGLLVAPGLVSSPRETAWQRLRTLLQGLRRKLRKAWQKPQPTSRQPQPSNPHIDYHTLVGEWRALREGARA